MYRIIKGLLAGLVKRCGCLFAFLPGGGYQAWTARVRMLGTNWVHQNHKLWIAHLSA